MKKIRVRILGFGETSSVRSLRTPDQIIAQFAQIFIAKLDVQQRTIQNNPGNYLPAKLDPKKQAVQRTIF
jgi:hypothetical protein